MDELRSADCLADMQYYPGARCHALKGDREGQLAVDLDHPYRLIFEVANDPIPLRDDGGLDWPAVTAVKIIKVEDYHGG